LASEGKALLELLCHYENPTAWISLKWQRWCTWISV